MFLRLQPTLLYICGVNQNHDILKSMITKSIIYSTLAAISSFGIAATSLAQIKTPAPSPSSTVIQNIGLVEAKVEYSRPSAKGRKVFGEVVPMDKIWRTGANSPTKLTFSDSVTIGGKKLAGGSYALYTIPGASSWTVILNAKATAAAWDYKDGDEAVKFTVSPVTLSSNVETFTMGFGNLTTTSADFMISWEKTSVSFSISTAPDAKIMADIKKAMDNTNNYWAAANYYLDNGKDLNQALEWVNKVVEKNKQYWTLHGKAKILAKLGRCAEAVAVAKESLAMAEKDDDQAYVRNNKKLIESCPVPATPEKKKK